MNVNPGLNIKYLTASWQMLQHKTVFIDWKFVLAGFLSHTSISVECIFQVLCQAFSAEF